MENALNVLMENTLIAIKICAKFVLKAVPHAYFQHIITKSIALHANKAIIKVLLLAMTKISFSVFHVITTNIKQDAWNAKITMHVTNAFQAISLVLKRVQFAMKNVPHVKRHPHTALDAKMDFTLIKTSTHV